MQIPETSYFTVDPSLDDFTQLQISDDEMEELEIENKVDYIAGNEDEDEDRQLEALNELMLTMKESNVDSQQHRRTEQQWLYQKVREGDFPPSIQPFQNIKSFAQFKKVLKAEQKKYNRQDYKYFSHNLSNQQGYHTIEARCYQCRLSDEEKGRRKIVLSMSKGAQFFKIRVFDTKHNHSYHGSKIKFGRGRGYGFAKNIMDQLRKDFDSAPKDISIDKFLEVSAKKYNLGLRKTKRYLYQIKRQMVSFTHIQSVASYFKIPFWFKNQADQEQLYGPEQMHMMQGEPDLFFFMHQKSKQSYNNIGEVCYVNFMDFKIKGCRQDKRYDILTLTGVSLGYMLEIFLIVFIEVQYKNSEFIAKLLMDLFKILGNIPKMIITPSEQFYDAIIYEMVQKHKYKGSHILDSIVQIDKICKIFDRYEDLAQFKTLLQSRTKCDYYENLQKLMKNCSPTPKIRHTLNRVMRLAPRMIFGCIESNDFMGTIFEYSGNKMVTDLTREHLLKFTFTIQNQDHGMVELLSYLKGSDENDVENFPIKQKSTQGGYTRQIKSQKVTYIRCVKNLIGMISRLHVPTKYNTNYDFKPYEEVVNIADMASIRRNLKANVLVIFGQQYGRIFYQDYFFSQGVRQDELKNIHIYDKPAMTIFTVAPCPIYNSEGGLSVMGLKCNCLFSFKSGIPCSHEVQAAMLTNSSLLDGIKKSFLMPQIYKKSGRPKRTRRNTEK